MKRGPEPCMRERIHGNPGKECLLTGSGSLIVPCCRESSWSSLGVLDDAF
jgi:hypothetical protein